MGARFTTKPTYATFTPNIKVHPGEQFTIFAVVENVGDAGGYVEVRVKDIGDRVLARQVLYIEAGGKKRVEFTFTAPERITWYSYWVEHFNLATGQQDWIHIATVHVVPRDVRVTVEAPDKVWAGEVFKAVARVEYFDGSKWLPLDARRVCFWVDYVLSREDVSRMKWAGAVNGVAVVDLRIDSAGEHYVCARVYDFDPLAEWYGFKKLSSCKKVIVESRSPPVTIQPTPRPSPPVTIQPAPRPEVQPLPVVQPIQPVQPVQPRRRGWVEELLERLRRELLGLLRW